MPRSFEERGGRTNKKDEVKLPTNVNVIVANPGVEQLRTEISGLVFASVGWNKALNKKLDMILEGLSSGLTPEQIEQLKRIKAKVEAIDKQEDQ